MAVPKKYINSKFKKKNIKFINNVSNKYTLFGDCYLGVQKQICFKSCNLNCKFKYKDKRKYIY